MPTRRDLLVTSLAGLAAVNASAWADPVAAVAAPTDPNKVYRIGVISSRIRGKPQDFNGHTWHFAQYFHPTVNLDAIRKFVDPGSAQMFEKFVRNPRTNLHALPFPDTRISHYYEADPKVAAKFCEAFPGVQVSTSLEKMVEEVDAVWLGDASGFGEDHFDLVAPGLAKGLPTFCDKPIGGSVAQTRKILEFAKEHKAPLMSSSLFRHEWGMEEALRRRDAGDDGPIQYVIASMQGGYTHDGWLIYGQHPVWTVMTLMGPGVEAVSLYARENAAHGLVTYPDRMPAEVWYGRPDLVGDYCSTAVHFLKRKFEFTPAIEGSFWMGHHYEMFCMADAFRQMVKTRVEPVPAREILEVTAIIHAGVKSRQEKSRLVALEEVLNA